MQEVIIPTPEQVSQQIEAAAVYVVGGTVQSTVSFSGTLTADIGNVKLQDQAGNLAEMPSANAAKNGGSKALLVQHIDAAGATLFQSTQDRIMNNFGTLAGASDIGQVRDSVAVIYNNQGTAATEATIGKLSATLTAIMNFQGTQTSTGQATSAGVGAVANNFGTLATAAGVAAVVNSFGTAATAANQAAGNASLANLNSAATAILNNQGTQATTALATSTGVGVVANRFGTVATSVNQLTEIDLLGRIYGAQGTQTTTNLATTASIAAVVNTQGTLATEATQLRVLTAVGGNPESRDAFGRTRVSQPTTLFDSKLLLDAAPHIWDEQQTSGSGTSSVYSKTDAAVIMSVSNATAGTRVRQTKRRFNYQPGKSQLVLMTFVLGQAVNGITRRVGLFDNFNGFYVEQTNSGVDLVIRKNGIASEIINQLAWNVDTLTGTGASGITLDLSKAHIFFIDFEWLGVGSVNFGFVIDGQFVRVHTAHHANIVTSVYTSSPNLPLRYELINSGVGGAASLMSICSTVMSEGGLDATGYPRSAHRGATALSAGNDTNFYALVGLRLTTAGTYATVYPNNINAVCTSTATYRYALVLNPTITGSGGISWTAIPNSAAEYAAATTSTNTVFSGTTLTSGYAVSDTGNLDITLSNFFGLGVSIDGTRDELWLCVQRVVGGAETYYGAINFLAQS